MCSTTCPSGHPADKEIGWAVANDITRGISETMFGPDVTLTRAQMVTFLYRLARLHNPATVTAWRGFHVFWGCPQGSVVRRARGVGH